MRFQEDTAIFKVSEIRRLSWGGAESSRKSPEIKGMMRCHLRIRLSLTHTGLKTPIQEPSWRHCSLPVCPAMSPVCYSGPPHPVSTLFSLLPQLWNTENDTEKWTPEEREPGPGTEEDKEGRGWHWAFTHSFIRSFSPGYFLGTSIVSTLGGR